MEITQLMITLCNIFCILGATLRGIDNNVTTATSIVLTETNTTQLPKGFPTTITTQTSVRKTDIPQSTEVLTSKSPISTKQPSATKIISSKRSDTSQPTEQPRIVTLNNIYCNPHETVVKTKDGFPYRVKLHRCKGVDDDTNKACNMMDSENVKYFDSVKYVEIKNHTKCAFGCKENNSSCNADEKWEEVRCKCKCKIKYKNCDKGMHWDGHHCECKVTSKQSNKKLCPNMVDVEVVYILAFVELLVVGLACFGIFLYLGKRRDSKHMKSENDEDEKLPLKDIDKEDKE